MTRYHQVVGIDIGATHVRAALAARRMGTPILVDAMERPLPADPELIPRAVREMLDANGWGRLPCVLGLSTDKLVLRSLALDDNDPRSESQVLTIETEPYVGPGVDETILDRTRMRGPAQSHLLIAVTRADTVEHTLKGMEEHGITVVDLLPNAVALYNAAQHQRRSAEQRYALVDLRTEGAELVLGAANCLLHAQRLASAPPSADAAARLEHWAREIRAAIDLFLADAGGPEPVALVLGGPGSTLPDVAGELARRTGLETSCWRRRFIRSDCTPGPYAVAAGLAQSRVDRGAVKLSLLPPGRKEAVTLRWQKRYWVLAACFAVAAMLISALAAHRGLDRLRTEVETRRIRLVELQEMQDDIERLRAEHLRVRRQIRPLRVALHNGTAMQAVIRAVAASKHPDDWIILVADASTYFESGEPDRAEPAGWLHDPEALLFDHIVVEGYTPVDDLTVLEEMIAGLREDPAIRDADLVPDDRVRIDAARDERWEGAGAKLFAIQIATALPPEIGDHPLATGGAAKARTNEAGR